MPCPGSKLVTDPDLYLHGILSLGEAGTRSADGFASDASGLFSGSDRRDDLI